MIVVWLIVPIMSGSTCHKGFKQLGKAGTVRNLRLQLPNDVLVQFLAGPRGPREGLVRPLLWLVASGTIVAGPLLVLTTLQYRFLPYQDEWVTWLHRLAVFVDLWLLWSLWPGIVSGRAEWRLRAWQLRFSFGSVSALVASLAVLAASGFAMTFPREWMDRTSPAQAFHQAMTWPLPRDPNDKTADPSWPRALFGDWVEWQADTAADQDWLERVPEARRVIPGTLQLANESFVGEDKLTGMEERNQKSGLKPWEGARTLRTGHRNLIAADLRFVNLSRADLRGAALDDASLEGAQLAGARLDGDGTSLVRVWLVQANMQGASLAQARLQATKLDHALLQGASLDAAQLQGASLVDAQFQGASLNGAQLQGAILFLAQLQGASLQGAQLQGASLFLAQLRGASLHSAQLQGSLLALAQLQGAALNHAQLQGVTLTGAQLQGASLDDAQFQGASLAEAYVFRASTSGTVLNPVIAGMNAEAKFALDPVTKEDLTDTIVDRWIADATKYVTDPDRKSSIDQRLAPLKAGAVAPDEDAKMSGFWANINKNGFDPTVYSRAIAELACTDSSSGPRTVRLAPYVARALTRYGILKATNDGLPAIAARMRSGREKIANCPGVEGFTDQDWAELDKLSPPPK